MKKIIISVLILLTPLSLTHLPALDKVTPVYKAPSPFASCVKPTVSGRGQSSFTFYNSCPQRVFINACVAESPGETKLYRSMQAIPVGGRYTIYTTNMRPNKIEWLADTVDPGAPGLCALNAQK